MRRAVVVAVAAGMMLVTLWGSPSTAIGAQGEASCTLPRLTLPLFGGTPVAEIAAAATPAAHPGTVSDEDIAAAIEQIVACINTGDPTLVYAVFTPRYLARQFVDPEAHYLPAFERMLVTTTPVTTEPLALISIEAVESLPDGRVRVDATFASAASTWRDRLVLVKSNGTWLIDEVQSADMAP